MRSRAAYFLIFTVFCSSHSIAQWKPPPGMENVGFASNVSDLLSDLVPQLGEQGDRSEAARAAFAMRQRISTAMDWTNQPGYLIEVPVEVEDNTGKRRLLGNPIPIGPGAKTEDILVLDSARDHIRAAPSSGFRYSSDDSFFIWATRTQDRAGKPDIRFWIMAPPLAAGARNAAAGLIADRNLYAAGLEAQKAMLMQGMIRHLEAQKHVTKAASEALNTLRAVEASKERLEAANTRLNQELKRAAAARAALGQIEDLRAVLTLGVMIETVSSSLDDAPKPVVAALGSKDAVIEYTRTYVQKKDGIVTTISQDISVSQTALDAGRRDLPSKLRSAGAPSDIIQYIR